MTQEAHVTGHNFLTPAYIEHIISLIGSPWHFTLSLQSSLEVHLNSSTNAHKQCRDRTIVIIVYVINDEF